MAVPVADFDALARAHMAQQVTQVAALQTMLARYWARIVRPDDFERTFAQWEVVARRLINAERTRGELTADEYYRAMKALAGLDGTVQVAVQPFEDDATQRALYSSGIGVARRRMAEGMTPEAAYAAAQAAVLRTAKRRALNAGRQRLIDLAGKDPDVSGWARVTDGSPCFFCAMLASRGPVYSAQGVGFRPHDGCGCSVRLIPKNDPTGGWAPDARLYRRMWDADAITDGVSYQRESKDARNAFRRRYEGARRDPDSEVSKAQAARLAP